MKNKIKIFILFSLFLLPSAAYSGTDFTLYPNTSVMGPFINFTDQRGTEAQFETLANKLFDLNGETLATGMAITNTIGYPNGKSTIKKFPFFEFGLAAGAGIYKYKNINRFDKQNLDANPVFPGFGANSGFHVGTGITDRIDITGKFFVIKPGLINKFVDISKEHSKSDTNQSFNFKVDDTSVYSMGIKTRYNLVRSKGIFLARFGGISLDMALDYMYSRFAVSTNYKKTLSNVEFTLTDPFAASHTINSAVSLTGDVNGSAELKTSILSITPGVFAYFDLLYLISFYTGPSLSLNAGSFNFNIDTRGSVSNSSPLIIPGTLVGDITLVDAGQEIAAATLISRNKMRPKIFIPRWTAGVELNLWVLKVQVEASTVLTSITESFIAQLGLRVNF